MHELLSSFPTTLRHARIPDGSIVDIALSDGIVQSVDVASTRPLSDDELDLEEFMLLPAAAEPHAHFDKAGSYDEIRPDGCDLEQAIIAWHSFSATMTEANVYERAREAIVKLIAKGTTAVRSHIDILPDGDALRSVRALLRLRDEFAHLIDIEYVALGTDLTPLVEYEAALDAGVDLVGGAPHLAADPVAEIDRLIDLAKRHNVGLDLHTDESLTGAVTLEHYAKRMSEWNPAALVRSAGHCVRLGTLEPANLAPVMEHVRAAGIGVITLPITNLYLQGWGISHSVPRGLTAIRELMDAGVTIGAGADNVQDPFNPLGRSDFLETAMLLVTAGHIDLPDALHLATNGSRAVMQLPNVTFTPGSPAEFVAVAGNSLSDVIGNARDTRYTIHRGQVIAHTQSTTFVARPSVVLP